MCCWHRTAIHATRGNYGVSICQGFRCHQSSVASLTTAIYSLTTAQSSIAQFAPALWKDVFYVAVALNTQTGINNIVSDWAYTALSLGVYVLQACCTCSMMEPRVKQYAKVFICKRHALPHARYILGHNFWLSHSTLNLSFIQTHLCKVSRCLYTGIPSAVPKSSCAADYGICSFMPYEGQGQGLKSAIMI